MKTKPNQAEAKPIKAEVDIEREDQEAFEDNAPTKKVKTRRAKRDPRDFYPTPAWCIDGLYKIAGGLPQATLDPCAGAGALVAGTWRRRGMVHARGIELDQALVNEAIKAGQTRVKQGDGLARSWRGEHIVMNPPYKDALTWIEKGVNEAVSVCALLPLGILASAKRLEFWRAHPPRGIFILSSRPSFTTNGRTDATDYAWIFWDLSYEGQACARDNEIAMGWIEKPKGTK